MPQFENLLCETGVETLVITTTSPRPWDGFLLDVKVMDEGDLIVFERLEQSLIIRGNYENRKAIANGIEKLSGQIVAKGTGARNHYHFDWASGLVARAGGELIIEISAEP